MPARRKSSEPQTPPATPKRSRSRRNGSSQGSQSSQISLGSQKYTAYLRERPTPTSDIYSQEKNTFSGEELCERLQLESSQPPIFNSNNNNDNDNVDDVIDNDDTNQSVPNIPTDRSVAVNNNNNIINNNNPIGLLSFICWILNFGWNNLIGNKRNRWLLFFVVLLLLLLLTFSNVEQENKSFMDYFSSSRIYIWAIDGKTYKIQPIGEKKKDVNDSIVVTLEDFKQMIIAEVKNYMDSENSKHLHLSSMSNEPLRALIRDEIKNIVSSDSKKGPVRRRGSSRDEETSIRKFGSTRDEKAVELIRNEARKVAKEELLKYSQDKLNRRDFALHSGGAKIISKYTSKTYEQWPNEWYKKTLAYVTGKGITRGKPPVTAISHDTNVGQCWPLSGQEGQLAIFLDRKVFVTAVTYDHISKDIATDDVLSAPKDFEVWGIIDDGTVSKNDDNDEDFGVDLSDDFSPRMESTEDKCGRRDDDQYDDGLSHLNHLEIDTNGELHLGSSPRHLYLGKFTYDINGLPIQTFEVPDHILKYNKPIRAIIMKIISNWGKPEYTCLYRFRVHGDPALPTVSASDPKIK
ncbi:unnamed protein product [Rhizophagus irregularis]|uniref:SUN domain-containing protein n=4 Tax=Rhizophagus irregularis TaxID=588596 RepID=A0A916EF18_9GLOM|nr:unnamed protein product [Rhizophagus irregularis]CAB5204457.1 unnamed protein product [Rhizophagus irregularis]CAB5377398.1 unnamed protein product [Rhizophagus irregularis]